MPEYTQEVEPYPSSAVVNPLGRHRSPPADVQNAEFSVFGYMPPGIERPATAGWTSTGPIAAALSRHATSQYVPLQYGRGWTNGDTGVVLFAGAGAQFARDTYAEYPPGALNTRHGNAPTLRHLLAATTRNPGRVELAGYAVGPRRNDERIAADRVYLFTDATTGADACGKPRTTTASSAPRHRPTTSTSSTSPGGRVRRPGCWRGIDGGDRHDCVIAWAWQL